MRMALDQYPSTVGICQRWGTFRKCVSIIRTLQRKRSTSCKSLQRYRSL